MSSAHIRSNASMVFFYANDNRDEFVNPFGGRTCPSMTPGQRNVRAWLWVKGRECQVGWDYESAGQQSETYGHHWLGHTMYQEDINISRIETIAAPGDVALRNWLRENEDSNA